MNELQFVFFPFFVAIFGRNNPDNDKIEQTLQIDDLNISRLRYFPSFSSRPSPPLPILSLFFRSRDAQGESMRVHVHPRR